jgi:hypothetical protein
MSRISTGSKSKQDYATPTELIEKLVKRYGPIIFDLAAEPHNKKHERYFAPPTKVIGYEKNAKGREIEIYEPNVDPEAAALDSLVQDWAALTQKYGGILWLNPPFRNIGPWSEKFWKESQRGANGFFLVPAATGSNWYLKSVWKKADRIFLNGRLPFMGKGQPAYNKDCMLCHFWPGATSEEWVWDWRKDVMHPQFEEKAA